MTSLPLLILTFAVTATAHADTNAEVGVVVEPNMTVYGGTPSIRPEQWPQILRNYGISARSLSVSDILEFDTLSSRTFPALVIPYGNAFPLPILKKLRAYHAQGGSLVLTGVPFTHPCERDADRWKDLGHRNHFQHDSSGVGTGGFTGARNGSVQIAQPGFQPNLLRLEELQGLLERVGTFQCLDTSTLDAHDEVIPLIEVLPQDGGTPAPVSALIQHRCQEFAGAVDLWIGQIASEMDAESAHLAEQILVRGVTWILHEKRALPDQQAESIFSQLASANPPEPLPTELTVQLEPRPWAETFLPKSRPPAKHLQLVDARPLSADIRTALACLQGLTSREQPRFWIYYSDRDLYWLDWHRERGYIESYQEVSDWRDLFHQYRGAYRGAIIPDPTLYRGELLAANAAACEQLILATPELARELDIPVTMDLRGRFTTYVDGMAWVWENYGQQLNRHLCEFIHPARLSNGAFAYAMQWRAVMFWIVGPVDAAEPGTDMFRETHLIAEILSEMAPNTAVLGFPYAGEGIGPGEVNGVTLASRYAKPLICTDSLANACVMSGVQIPELSKEPLPPPPLEKDKIYVALAMSDGDNQNTWLAFFKQYVEHRNYGSFPLAFGMGPPIMDLMPGVAQWYYEHAAPNTEFLADVSGIGYIQPENYALAFAERDAVFDDYLRWTESYLQKMGMKTLRTVGGDDELLQRYASALPWMHSLFADMGRYSGREGIGELTYRLDSGMPVFRSVTSWRYGKAGFLRELREQVGDRRPAFVNGFVHCWTFSDVGTIHDEIVRPAESDIIFVTPSQLAALYGEASSLR